MIAIVQQGLGHVHCAYARVFVLQSIEHKFVLAQPLNRQVVNVFECLFNVVGVECSQFSHIFKVFFTQR